MATHTTLQCDLCGNAIDDLASGASPTKIMVEPTHGPEIGSAHDTKDACSSCRDKLYEVFPKLKDAERLVQPVAVPVPTEQTPAALDTVTAEGLIRLLAEKLGVKVVDGT